MTSRQLAIAQAALAGIALVGTVVLAALGKPIPDVLSSLDYSLAGALIGGALTRGGGNGNPQAGA